MELNSEQPVMDDEEFARLFDTPIEEYSDPALAETLLAAAWLKKLEERHQDRLAADPRVMSHLVGCARRLARETPQTLSARGRQMLAARGGRARQRSMTPEQGADLQRKAVEARKRKARERREAARVSDAPAARSTPTARRESTSETPVQPSPD